MGFGDRWATIHVRSKAIGCAIGLVGLVLYISFLDTPDVVEVRKSSGELIDLSKGKGVNIGRVKVETGEEIKVYLNEPLPKIGATVPLRVEVYDDGSKSFRIDSEAVLDQLME